MQNQGTTEQRLRAAVESSPSGILMVDANGVIVLVNREVERLFGYPREELLGRTVDVLVPARFHGQHPSYRAGFMRDPKVRAMGAGRELYGRRKDGTEVPVEIGLTPVVTAEGIFVLSSIVDISARKKAEAERMKLEEQLRHAQKMEVVGTLAGGIAHDFNNILGAIVGYGELLRERINDPSVRADVDELLRAAARGRLVIERILRFSRRGEQDRRPVDLAQIVQEAAQLLRPTLPANIELRLSLAPDTPRVLADATSVHQVLLNLSTNAAHAMPDGGLLEITLEPFYVRDSTARAHPDLREGPHALLSVRDTGRGMSPDVLARAFEPFFTTKPPGSGSGLGLAMVRGIMREHQGAATAESAPGSGTRVRCYFPAIGAELSEAPLLDGETPRGHGERIMYVDDEEALVEVGRRRLEALGYEVVGFTDPEAALEQFVQDPFAFDAVVTDYSMPHRTGLDLAWQISRLRSGIPIIMLTGFIEDLPADRTQEAGISVVLKKPVTLHALGGALRSQLASG